MAFFELRQYKVLPGKMDGWVKVMEEEIIPLQIQNGVVVLGSWIVEDEPDIFVWMRRFEDEADRVKKYEAIYESDQWKNDLLPRIVELVDRDKHRVKRLIGTSMSPIR